MGGLQITEQLADGLTKVSEALYGPLRCDLLKTQRNARAKWYVTLALTSGFLFRVDDEGPAIKIAQTGTATLKLIDGLEAVRLVSLLDDYTTEDPAGFYTGEVFKKDNERTERPLKSFKVIHVVALEATNDFPEIT